MSESSGRRARRKSEAAALVSPDAAKGAVHPNPFLAFRAVVYAYGVPELAAEMGYRVGTLYNKADADAESHHQPTLRDVIDVTRTTGDTRVLESLDRMFDRSGFELPPDSTCSDEHLLELLCRVGSESGQLHEAVRAALADRRFTAAEMQKVRGEAFDLVSQVMAFLARLESLVDG